MTISKDLAKISWDLMMQSPFWGNFMLGINKIERSDIPTAGVCKNNIGVQLAINPEFWNKLTKGNKLFLLEHEILHVGLQHLNLRSSFSCKETFNIAADLVVNQLVYCATKNPSDIIEGSMTLELMKDQFKLTLDANESTKYYYDKLIQEQEKNPNGALAKFVADSKLHGTWVEIDGLSETEKQLIKKQIDYQIRKMVEASEKMRGLVPSYFKDYVDSLFEKKAPVIDWKGYMRRFMGATSEIFTKKTRRKQSKRFSENPGLKIKQKKRILFGIDTSGSMSQQDLVEGFNEVYHVWKTGVAVDIMEIDADVHRVYPFKGKWDGTVSGRGGRIVPHYTVMYN